MHSWYLPGTHYAKTLEAWLVLQDSNRSRWLSEQGMKDMLQGKDGGPKAATAMFNRFRLFFLSCAEFFALNNGESWGVVSPLLNSAWTVADRWNRRTTYGRRETRRAK